MNKLIIAFAMLILLLSGCSSNEFPEELLSDEGKFSYLVVYPDDNSLGSQDFLEKVDNYGKQASQKIDHGLILYLDNAQSRYPSLNIEQAPYYMFFDSEGVILETSDKEEANSFIESKFEQ
ncbi:MAG: hypothetical protein ACQEUT_20020 [Bacillota bacterium]